MDGCYDEVGNLYRLPEVVVSDPVNMREDGEGEGGLRLDASLNSNNIDGETMIGVPASKIAARAEDKVLDRDEGDVETEDKGILDRRREEKGKASERDAVRVRCRLSDRGGPDVVITLGKTQHVATLVRRVQREGQVSLSIDTIASHWPRGCSSLTGWRLSDNGYTGLVLPPHPSGLPGQDPQ